MNIEQIEEECRDTDINVIKNEIEIFFEDKACLFVFKDNNYYLGDTNICLSGDNLITKKQMWRRVHHQRKTPEGIENDKLFLSYIVLPRIKNDYSSNVNLVRNSTYGYNDNPFLLFNTLRKMYICEFNESISNEPLDTVEKSIIQTKEFWELFGRGIEGYMECERAFCVNGILELCEKDKYKKFLNKGIPEVDELVFYEELLDKLRIIRGEQMRERLETMK